MLKIFQIMIWLEFVNLETVCAGFWILVKETSPIFTLEGQSYLAKASKQAQVFKVQVHLLKKSLWKTLFFVQCQYLSELSKESPNKKSHIPLTKKSSQCTYSLTKYIGWLQGQLSLLSFRDRSNEYQGVLGIQWLKVKFILVVALQS